MQTFTIRRRSNWADALELQEAAGRSTQVGNEEMSDKVRWIRSYVVQEEDGRLGTVCIYQAVDAAAIKEHAQRAG
ncbi:MAG TPA: nickel-binding protein, partial [Gammaproteobacteria bacterium]|nr:nickel-binding protein [Gammaproteobacteria bacterium]